jgi:hypothetical protein
VKVGCYHHPWVGVQMRNYRKEWTWSSRLLWALNMQRLHGSYGDYDYAAWKPKAWVEFRPGQWVTMGDFGNYIAGYGAGYGPPDLEAKQLAVWGDYVAGAHLNGETDIGGFLGDSQRSTYWIDRGFDDGLRDSYLYAAAPK